MGLKKIMPELVILWRLSWRISLPSPVTKAHISTSHLARASHFAPVAPGERPLLSFPPRAVSTTGARRWAGSLASLPSPPLPSGPPRRRGPKHRPWETPGGREWAEGPRAGQAGRTHRRAFSSDSVGGENLVASKGNTTDVSARQHRPREVAWIR